MNKTAHDLAKEMADALFINGEGKKAERLVLDMNPYKPMTAPGKHKIKSGGGWCHQAVIVQIEEILKQNLFWSLK